MKTDVFRKRATALEDEFFRRVDEKLTQKLRDQWQHDVHVQSLKKESRIEDEVVIEELLAAGIRPGMIQAMTLVPTIHVAWARSMKHSGITADFAELWPRDGVLDSR